MIPLLLASIVLLAALLGLLGAKQKWPSTPRRVPVTVVVCARDEESSIGDTLESLTDQTYPSELMQILAVDHLSQDNTGDIMEQFAAESSVRTRVLHVEDEDDSELRGKVQALELALREVGTEFVLLTDGDCVVPRTWVDTMLSYFTPGVAVVNSMVAVKAEGSYQPLLARMQHTLNRMFLALSAGYSSLQVPADNYLPVFRWFRPILKHLRPSFNMGNNQGLRMSVYRDVGGFRKVGPTLIEDVALVNRILFKTKYKVAVIIDRDAMVTTRPSSSWVEFWRQVRRWGSATGDIVNYTNTFLYAVVFMMRIALPWMFLIFPLSGVTAFALVVYAEYKIADNASRLMGERQSTRDFLLHVATQIAMNHLLVFAFMLKWPVVWKGHIYRD